MSDNNMLVPTPKVAAGFSVGMVTSLIIYELRTRFGIELAGEEAAFLTVALSFIGSWFAPKSKPTAAEISKEIARRETETTTQTTTP